MFFHPKNLISEKKNNPWFKPCFNILLRTQSVLRVPGIITLYWVYFRLFNKTEKRNRSCSVVPGQNLKILPRDRLGQNYDILPWDGISTACSILSRYETWDRREKLKREYNFWKTKTIFGFNVVILSQDNPGQRTLSLDFFCPVTSNPIGNPGL